VDIPDGVTSVEANNMVQAYAELVRAYGLANNVNKAYCKCILKACDDKCMSVIADPIVRYANETVISLLTDMEDCYAFVSPIELVEKLQARDLVV
jgi:hypothetical protein